LFHVHFVSGVLSSSTVYTIHNVTLKGKWNFSTDGITGSETLICVLNVTFITL